MLRSSKLLVENQLLPVQNPGTLVRLIDNNYITEILLKNGVKPFKHN